MTACPTLTTERLILRPLEESDLGPYTDMLLAPDVRRSLHLPEDFSRADAWRGMAAWRGQWELRGSGQWALEERAGGRFVGRAGLHRPEQPDWPGLEVGWALHPSRWGHGYATEAGHRSITYAFEVLGGQGGTGGHRRIQAPPRVRPPKVAPAVLTRRWCGCPFPPAACGSPGSVRRSRPTAASARP